MIWSDYQERIFKWIDAAVGNLIVVAVAGSGKTTTLIEMVRRMEGSVMLLAFNRKIAEELKSRISRVAEGQLKYAGTFHSVGFRALTSSMRGVRFNVDEKKVAKLFDAYVDRNGDEYKPYYGFVVRAVSMAKQRGIGLEGYASIANDESWSDMVYHFGIDNELAEDQKMETGISIAQDLLLESNKHVSTVDFDDMLYLPLLKKVKFYQYDWVLIDEAQDTNPVRRMVAKKLLKKNGRVVAVGDPHQAIYGFAGADNNALALIGEEFNCDELPLTITYRCPKSVVAHAQQWVSHIEAADTAPVGEVKTAKYDELLDQGLNKYDAILCRYNKYLVATCFKLIRYGIPARIEGREIGEGLIKLTKKWKVRSLDALRHRLEDYRSREVNRALEKKQEGRADRINDQVETLYVLIDRGMEKGLDVRGLESMIREMFEDNVKGKGILTLSSCHKAKGLEWERVFILGRSELMPSPFARQEWQQEQEKNLIYVAVTRAKKTLIEVTGVKVSGNQDGTQN